MKPFLQEVAEQIFEKHRENMRDVHILVPNRRAILYLKKYFSEATDQPLWAPQMLSIEDFVFQASGLKKCETIDLLFELYAIHRNITESDARSFDEFVQWGEQLLSDFNDVDSYLVDANTLFSYLSESKAIERWHIDSSELTDNEKKYLEFYNSLSTYYNMLREKLQLENKAWQGLAYRLLYENFETHFEIFAQNPFYLVGFNALTTVEEEIFKKIRRNAPTTILWDIDDYYVESPQHEAGHFFRLNRRTFNDNFEPQQNFKSPKRIVISGVAKNIGQAIEAGRILEQLPETANEPNHTAVVLNNENLLFPILDFIPKKYETFNVTMGYPFRLSLLYNFFIAWVELHLWVGAMQKERYRFEKKNLIDLLRHPVLQESFNDFGSNTIALLEKNIAASYHHANLFIDIDEIKQELFKDLPEPFNQLSFAFDSWNNDAALSIRKIQQMVDFLRVLFSKTENSMNQEFLFHLNKAVNQLHEVRDKYSSDISVQSVFFVFKRILQSIKVPFSGEPIEGLQIMGLLETRLLDYKNVILLSVNEGVVPSQKNNSSFISFDIRRQFKLPTHHETNAISAYYFYRLLQRAENIHILYNFDNSGGVGNKEQSRFITQIQQELKKYSADIQIITKIETSKVSEYGIKKNLVIEKTPFAIQQLNAMAINGISPSDINAYLNCPVDFYLDKIVKIPNIQEITDVIDSAIFGTIIHAAIQETHQHLLNKSLVSEDITPIFTSYKAILEAQFKKAWDRGDFNTGKNYLKYIVAQDYMEAFLKAEQQEIEAANKENLPYFILEQECKVKTNITINTEMGEKNILIKGFIDRVARVGNTIRIIDFKTGSVNGIDIKSKDDFLEEKKSPKTIQILMYTWLMQQENKIPAGTTLEAGFISFRNVGAFIKLSVEGKTIIDNDTLQFTETMLRDVLEEIFNQNIPFIPSENTDSHKYSRFLPLYQ